MRGEEHPKTKKDAWQKKTSFDEFTVTPAKKALGAALQELFPIWALLIPEIGQYGC